MVGIKPPDVKLINVSGKRCSAIGLPCLFFFPKKIRKQISATRLTNPQWRFLFISSVVTRQVDKCRKQIVIVTWSYCHREELDIKLNSWLNRCTLSPLHLGDGNVLMKPILA